MAVHCLNTHKDEATTGWLSRFRRNHVEEQGRPLSMSDINMAAILLESMAQDNETSDVRVGTSTGMKQQAESKCVGRKPRSDRKGIASRGSSSFSATGVVESDRRIAAPISHHTRQ